LRGSGHYTSGNVDADIVIVEITKNLSKTELLRKLASPADYEIVDDLQD